MPITLRLLSLFLATWLAVPAQTTTPPPLAALLSSTIDAQGLDAARARYASLQAEHFASVMLDEAQLNALGYHYLAARKLPEALAVLRWNTELFPSSGNVFDSYGEALVKNGEGEAAIRNYEKAVTLDPHNQNAVAVLAELKARPDAVELMQERMRLEDELEAASDQAGPIAIDNFRERVRALVTKNPVDSNAGLVNNFLYVSESVDLAGAVADWKYFAGSPNARIRALGEAKQHLADSLATPLEMKFTAADGRAVDLAQLRGKVVLVDFWATWCGPCREEIPNVVATYEKYHAQGFEIVGISFDRAPDPAKPSKSAKTAEQVLAFTRENRMPWPQFYDGLFWKNTFGLQYGINAIPAMFLLDRTGHIVSTNARGAQLEARVKGLLGPS